MEHEKLAILEEAHEGVASGHYSGEVTTRSRVWIGSVPKAKAYGAHLYPTTCTSTQNSVMSAKLLGWPTEKSRMAYKLVLPLEPFQKKWGFGLCRTIHSSSNSNKPTCTL